MEDRKCKHCGFPLKHGRPRGLCWRCFKDLDVRKKYPTQEGYTNGMGLGLGPFAGEPAQATEAGPGTEAKLRAMEERVRLGLGLHHPGDGVGSLS